MRLALAAPAVRPLSAGQVPTEPTLLVLSFLGRSTRSSVGHGKI